MDASASSSSSARISLKRKAATAATSKLKHESDDEEGEEEEPSSMDESEDGDDRDDAARPTDEAAQNDDDQSDTAIVKPRPAKKAKKALKPKVAVWADLQGWKEGDDPLGRFPVEVLDLIINIDADLDLRDHLALAATCRYFRTCYRDVVFQVLFDSKHPRIKASAAEHIQVDERGSAHSTLNYGVNYYGYLGGSRFEDADNQPRGPWSRSWNEARWIFSSSKLPRDGWAVPNDEWEGSDDQNTEAKQLKRLTHLLANDRDKKRPILQRESDDRDRKALEEWEAKLAQHQVDERARNLASKAAGTMLVWNQWTHPAPYKPTPGGNNWVEVKMAALLAVDIAVYGEGIRPPTSSVVKLSKYEKKQLFFDRGELGRDPWASQWRYLVAEVVNKPRITKTDAKATYKVSERELLTLKKVHKSYWSDWGAPKHYMKAAVEALSLRSHGGANGHGAYLAKLEVKRKKAHATMVKNGTLKVAKPSYRNNFYGFWGDGYGEFDSDGY